MAGSTEDGHNNIRAPKHSASVPEQPPLKKRRGQAQLGGAKPAVSQSGGQDIQKAPMLCNRAPSSVTTTPRAAVQELNQARQAFAQGDKALCVSKCETVLKLDPNNQDALYMLGRSLSELNRWSEALIVANRLVSMNKSSTTHLFRGQCLLKHRQLRKAANDFTAAIAASPSAQAYSARAECYLLMGQTEKCLEDTTQALAIKANDLPSLTVRGDCYLKSGEPSAALKSFQLALNISTRDSTLWSRKGEALMVMKQPEAALTCFEMAARCSGKPKSFAYAVRADVKVKRGDFEGALDDLSHGISIDPSNTELYRKQGCLQLMAMHDPEAAERCFNRALILDPTNADAMYERAAARVAQDKYKLALEDETRALAIKPNDLNSYIGRADLYVHLNDYPRAIADYSRAASTNPIALGKRARVFLRMGRYREAVADFNRLIAINGDDKHLHEDRAASYLALGEGKNAVTDLTWLIERYPRSTQYYLDRAKAYTIMGRQQQAERDKRMADELNK